MWELNKIIVYQGPLYQQDSNYQGFKYNVTVQWSNRETINESLFMITVDVSIVCTIYVKEKNIFDLPGWKRFKYIVYQQKKIFTDVNKIKLRNCHSRTRFKYGIEIPRNYNDIKRIDKSNSNTL